MVRIRGTKLSYLTIVDSTLSAVRKSRQNYTRPNECYALSTPLRQRDPLLLRRGDATVSVSVLCGIFNRQ
jgi:hypothetical protein